MKKLTNVFCVTVVCVFFGVNLFLSFYEFNHLIYFCTGLITLYLLVVYYFKVPKNNKRRVNKVVSKESPFKASEMNHKLSDLNVVFHDFKDDHDIEMVSTTSMHIDPSSVAKLDVTSKFVKLLYDPNQLPSNFLNFN